MERRDTVMGMDSIVFSLAARTRIPSMDSEFGQSSGIHGVQKRKPETREKAKSFSTKQKDWLGGLDFH